MELDVAADQPAGAFKQRHLLWRDEGGMGRGQAIVRAHLFGGAQQGRRQGFVSEEQARAGGGRERRGDLHLGVIAAPGPVPGIGPGMVEHIFALACGFSGMRARRRRACPPHPQ